MEKDQSLTMANDQPPSPMMSSSTITNNRDHNSGNGADPSYTGLPADVTQNWTNYDPPPETGNRLQPWARSDTSANEAGTVMRMGASADSILMPGYPGTFLPPEPTRGRSARTTFPPDYHNGNHRMHEKNLLLLEDAREEAERASIVAEAAHARYRIILEYVQKNSSSSQGVLLHGGSEAFYGSRLPSSAGVRDARINTFHGSQGPTPRSHASSSPPYPTPSPRGMHSWSGRDTPPNPHHFPQPQAHRQVVRREEENPNQALDKRSSDNGINPRYAKGKGDAERSDEPHSTESADSTKKNSHSCEDSSGYGAGDDDDGTKRSTGHSPGEDSLILPPKKRARKDPNRPRRPLSAYNIFFSEERAKILNELSDDKDDEKKNDVELPSEAMTRVLSRSEGRKKSRKHKKCHGKITFVDLAKIIGKKWKNLSNEEQDIYQNLANKDMENYREAMKSYKPPASERLTL